MTGWRALRVNGQPVQDRGLADATLTAAGALIVVLDTDWHIARFNRQCEQLSGYAQAEALGRHYEFLIPPAEREKIAAILEAIVTGAQVEHVSHWLTKDGDPRLIRWSGAALTSDGQRTHVVVAGFDITELQRTEDELADRAARLAVVDRELTRANAELSLANTQLARSNADLEQFAFVASHDLREPLRAISLPIQVLAERYRGQLDEKADEFLGYALEGCQRMEDRIRGLLALARVSQAREPRRPTDIGRVVAQAVATLKPVLDDASAAVVTVEPLPVVDVEPEPMAQVFENLIGNAVKFVAPGVKPEVTISAERVGPDWRFEVTDNGIGILPRNREHIFTMFKQLSTTGQYSGTGIGLALVKSIIERHEGEVGIDQAPTGTGCSFWFTLPAEMPEDLGAAEATAPVVAGRSETPGKE